jgi:hypothetical protein
MQLDSSGYIYQFTVLHVSMVMKIMFIFVTCVDFPLLLLLLANAVQACSTMYECSWVCRQKVDIVRSHKNVHLHDTCMNVVGFAGRKWTLYKVTKMCIFMTQDRAKPYKERRRGLNFMAVRHTIVQKHDHVMNFTACILHQILLG